MYSAASRFFREVVAGSLTRLIVIAVVLAVPTAGLVYELTNNVSVAPTIDNMGLVSGASDFIVMIGSALIFVVGFAPAAIALSAATRTAREDDEPTPVGTLVILGAVVGLVASLLGSILGVVAASVFLLSESHAGFDPYGALVIPTGGIAVLCACVVVWGALIALCSVATTRLASRRTTIIGASVTPAALGILTIVALFIGHTQAVAEYEWSQPLHGVQDGLGQSDDSGNITMSKFGVLARTQMDEALGTKDARLLYDASAVEQPNKAGWVTPQTHRVTCVGCHSAWISDDGQGSDGVGALTVVGDESDLRAMLGEPISARSRATLASGGVVSLYPQLVDEGYVSLEWRGDTGKLLRTRNVRGTVQRPKHAYDFGLMMSKATAARLGLTSVPAVVLADLPTDPTHDQIHRLTQLLKDTGQSDIVVERGPDPGWPVVPWQVLGLTILVTLIATAGGLAVSGDPVFRRRRSR